MTPLVAGRARTASAVHSALAVGFDIGKMPAAVVRVVSQEDVARMDVVTEELVRKTYRERGAEHQLGHTHRDRCNPSIPVQK